MLIPVDVPPGDSVAADETLAAFEGAVPVPMVVPAAKFGEGERRPWYFRAD